MCECCHDLDQHSWDGLCACEVEGCGCMSFYPYDYTPGELDEETLAMVESQELKE